MCPAHHVLSAVLMPHVAQLRDDDPRRDGPVAVIGAGIAGLITAHTLLRDGFDVQVLTRDMYAGGNWTEQRIYPNLYLNNVHGEYRVSPLDMPPPTSDRGLLCGDDIHDYMKEFASKFLEGRIQTGIDVRNIHRDPSGKGWQVEVMDANTGKHETRAYRRVVLCTGGSSTPKFPPGLTEEDAISSAFQGMFFHSTDFGSKLVDLLSFVPLTGRIDSKQIVLAGGGKSAQDMAAYLANEGRKVTVVCPTFDAFLAGPKPLPAFIRKSRLLSLFSPHIHLRTWLERFIHTTWLGKKLFDFMWHGLEDSAFQAAGVPADSPLRLNAVSPFWHIRVNDEGVPRRNGFPALVGSGQIHTICPGRVKTFGSDGESVVLEDGTVIPAAALILATGYRSSWHTMFDVYRGLVPAKHINRRDFALNGAVVSPHFGYTCEVAAHWISSYFLHDELRLPATPEAALEETERHAAWLRARYPQIPTALNGSHASYLAFWTWPQHVDDLLEDMGLRVMRSGGNWLTWPFKVIDLSEIATLKAERDGKRAFKKAWARGEH
ncbi:FAD/NAD(P)-binding domain-containing protein [Ganoderma leucocontextum]|nr:FAD/NAD(P)-binding domain-containing protein [Ganoderma leucocontextum]